MASLNLSHCRNLTDYGFSFVSSLISLISLDLYNCDTITTLFPISSMTNLTSLNLSECRDLTDDGLSFISSSLTNLTDLSLRNCTSLTETGLSYLTPLEKLKGFSHVLGLRQKL